MEVVEYYDILYNLRIKKCLISLIGIQVESR